MADPLNDYAAIERAAIAGDPWALGYVASHQAAVSALADAWDEGRQWLAQQGGDVTTDDDPNPYRAALAAAGAGAEGCYDEHDPDGHGTVQCERPAGHDGEHRSTVTGERRWAAAGAEVDREALHQQAYRLLTGRDEPWGGCDQREAVERIADALAARGDAATPTVTAEQVERAYWATEEGITMEDLTTILAALGIEIEGGEQRG